MERVEFEQLKSQVLTLTNKQRQQVQALLQVETTSKAPAENNQLLLWDVVGEVWVRNLRAANPAPLAVITERLGSTLKAATFACDSVISIHAPEFTRTQRAACYRMFVQVVFDFLNTTDIPVNGKSILQQLANIAQHLDCAFPGYAASNILGFVLRRLVGAS